MNLAMTVPFSLSLLSLSLPFLLLLPTFCVVLLLPSSFCPALSSSFSSLPCSRHFLPFTTVGVVVFPPSSSFNSHSFFLHSTSSCSLPLPAFASLFLSPIPSFSYILRRRLPLPFPLFPFSYILRRSVSSLFQPRFTVGCLLSQVRICLASDYCMPFSLVCAAVELKIAI